MRGTVRHTRTNDQVVLPRLSKAAEYRGERRGECEGSAEVRLGVEPESTQGERDMLGGMEQFEPS